MCIDPLDCFLLARGELERKTMSSGPARMCIAPTLLRTVENVEVDLIDMLPIPSASCAMARSLDVCEGRGVDGRGWVYYYL